MNLKKVTTGKDWKQIKNLYMTAFPACERKPLTVIRYKQHKKVADVWMLEDEGEFIGLAITMNGPDLVLLDYFAIDESKRGNGYGAKALKLLQEIYADYRFFLEIERIDVEADNIEERKRRKSFYLKNGMTELKVYAVLFGVEMELLGYQCKVNFEEYHNLYVSNYGKIAEKNVIKSVWNAGNYERLR